MCVCFGSVASFFYSFFFLMTENLWSCLDPATIFTASVLFSKSMFASIIFKFFDLKDCLSMDSMGLVVFEVSSPSLGSPVKAFVNIF